MAWRRQIFLWLFPAAGLLAGGVGAWWFTGPGSTRGSAAEVSPATAAGGDSAHADRAALNPVHINPGPVTPTVRADPASGSGSPAQVACATCHTTRPPDLTICSGAQLTEFHQGLHYAHGQLSCLSCHNATNYDTLRHADGTAIAYSNTIQLCAQCHGTHYRDYLHGSHGGMTGHWDLTAGPRARNTCTDCHNAHAPAYPRVQPVFPPQDRGARQQRDRADHENAPKSSPHE